MRQLPKVSPMSQLSSRRSTTRSPLLLFIGLPYRACSCLTRVSGKLKAARMRTPWAIPVENKVDLAHGHQSLCEILGTKVGQAKT